MGKQNFQAPRLSRKPTKNDNQLRISIPSLSEHARHLLITAELHALSASVYEREAARIAGMPIAELKRLMEVSGMWEFCIAPVPDV
jgi:hypothetical protein